MSLTLLGATETERTRLTDGSVTTVLSKDPKVTLVSIALAENNGATPTVSLDVYDGTNARYLQKSVALTAGGRVTLDLTGEVIHQHEVVRAMSSDASGHVDVAVTYIDPWAAGKR